MDRLELVRMLLGHPADMRADFGEFLLDVRDVRYAADRETVVLLLCPDDLETRCAALSGNSRPGNNRRTATVRSNEHGRGRRRRRASKTAVERMVGDMSRQQGR